MSNTFKTWDEVQKDIFTPEEIAESNLRVALVGEIIKARKEKGLSQRFSRRNNQSPQGKRTFPKRA